MSHRLLLAGSLLGALGLPCLAQDVHGVTQRSALRFELGPRTQLLLQPPQRLAGLPEQSRASESGLGVELKLRPASSSRDLQQLLRLQLSQRSALQFRPRSGGLVISYREQF
jgi:hypothetical protein